MMDERIACLLILVTLIACVLPEFVITLIDYWKAKKDKEEDKK